MYVIQITASNGQFTWACFFHIFSGNKGKLLIDGNIKGESEADGTTKNIEVNTIFHLGGLPSEKMELDIVKRNLMVTFSYILLNFYICLRLDTSYLRQFEDLKALDCEIN